MQRAGIVANVAAIQVVPKTGAKECVFFYKVICIQQCTLKKNLFPFSEAFLEPLKGHMPILILSIKNASISKDSKGLGAI